MRTLEIGTIVQLQIEKIEFLLLPKEISSLVQRQKRGWLKVFSWEKVDLHNYIVSS